MVLALLYTHTHTHAHTLYRQSLESECERNQEPACGELMVSWGAQRGGRVDKRGIEMLSSQLRSCLGDARASQWYAVHTASLLTIGIH